MALAEKPGSSIQIQYFQIISREIILAAERMTAWDGFSQQSLAYAAREEKIPFLAGGALAGKNPLECIYISIYDIGVKRQKG